MSPANDNRRQRWLIGGVLLTATLVLFLPVRHHEFINYDDPVFVTQNPRVLAGLAWDNVVWAFTTTYADYWRPVAWLSHMLDVQCFGLRPGGHHLMNVFFHLVNTGLLFGLLARMTNRMWPSAVVAALFAWHPLHVESVAWVAERKDVLSTTFWLVALWAYMGYAGKPTTPRYLLVLLSFALGLMTKPMVVTLPCALLLLDFWPLRRLGSCATTPAPRPTRPTAFGRTGQPRIGFLILEKLPFFGLSALASLLAFQGQRKMAAVATLATDPLTERITNALVSYARYLGKTVFPAHLAVFYPRPEHWSAWQVGLALAVLLGLSVVAVRGIRGRPYLFVGWFWFVGTLVPVIGLVQVGDQAMADRYTYIPLIGVFLMAAWTVADWAERQPARRWAVGGAAGAAVAACVVTSGFQLQYWRNTQTLFEHTLAVTDNNPVAATVVGSLRAEQQRYDDAIRLFTEALRIRPDYSDAHVHWGQTLERQGKLEEATVHYRQAIQIKPTYEEAHLVLGLALVRQRQYEEAIQQYTEVLRLNPDSAAAHNNLALTLHAQGKLDEAIAHYDEVLRLSPSLVETRGNLALALHARGRLAEAIAHYAEVLRRRPESAGVHLNLGGALMGVGRTDEAVEHYREALRLSPDLPEALNKLAWLRATSANARNRDGLEALRLARRACALTGYKDPRALATLAAAQAENGQFGEAVKVTQDAIALASAAGNNDMVGAFQLLLRDFQDGRPYREGQSGSK